MNYSSRLVTKSNMAVPDEFIIVVNTRKSSSVATFQTYKGTSNWMKTVTAVYLSNSAATSGGTTNLRNSLGWYDPTTLSNSKMKNRPPTSTTTTTTTPEFLC